jgi:D-3-phosphoglycerate dehydrogenase / 2-oxoglutarate reductase
MPTILFDCPVPPVARALAESGHTLVGPLAEDTPERRQGLAAADALIVSSLWALGDAELAAAPRLKVIARPGVGYDNVDVAAATRHGVLVVTTPDAPSQSTAEHAVTLLLALAKGLVRSEAGFRGQGWSARAGFFGMELRGKTLGLVGVGRIGGIVAKTCREGLGMRVLAYDPFLFLNPPRAQALGVELQTDLQAMLAHADFVSVHCPLTPETRGLIGAAELTAMRPSSYLINCARGPILDQAALAAALQDGTIAGAGLDVFDEEPLPSSHPLFDCPNLILTPHIASHTAECERAMHLGAMTQVLAALRGERPAWLMNPEVWGRQRS